MQKEKYNSLDICKLLMAFFVVAIHTLQFSNPKISDIFYSTVNMAVPFFFLTSGFLLAKKMQPPSIEMYIQNCLGKYLHKIIKMYIIWTAIYSPIALYCFVKYDTGFFLSVFIYIRGLFLRGEQSYSWQLWYLLSTIYGLLYIKICYKLLKTKHIVILGSCFFLLGSALTFLSEYDGNLPNGISLFRKFILYTISSGRIFSSFFYLPLGILLFKTTIRNSIFLLLFVAGLMLNILVRNVFFSEILTGITSVGFFGIVKSVSLPNSSFYLFARKMSITIYLIHMWVFVSYCYFAGGEILYGFSSFFITCGVSVIIAYIVTMFQTVLLNNENENKTPLFHKAVLQRIPHKKR